MPENMGYGKKYKEMKAAGKTDKEIEEYDKSMGKKKKKYPMKASDMQGSY